MTKARDIADGGGVDTSSFLTSDSTLNPAKLDTSGTIPSQLLAGVGGGKLLQVESNNALSPISVNTQSYSNHIYGTVSITPTAENSKILVIHTAPSQVYVSNTGNMGHVALFRDSTNITTSGHNNSFASYDQTNYCQGSDITVLDTPSYTLGDTINYSVRCKVDNTALTMIYGTHYSNLSQPKLGGLTLIEIAA